MSTYQEDRIKFLESVHEITDTSSRAIDLINSIETTPDQYLADITVAEWKSALRDVMNVITLQREFIRGSVEHTMNFIDLLEKSFKTPLE